MRKEICRDEENYSLFLFKSEYRNNGRLYLGFECYGDDYKSYDFYDDLTINLSDMLIENDDIIFINSYVPDSILEQLENRKLIEYIDIVQYNLGRYKKYKVNRKIMEEYLGDK